MMPSILSIVEAKGWYLYKAFRGADLPGLVARGKADTIEQNVPYAMLPAASRPGDLAEVQAHVANARRTGQLPTYRDRTHSASRVESIVIGDAGLSIKTRGSEDAYLIRAHEMEAVAKLNLSTCNVYFFSSIDELREFFCRQGLREQTPTALPAQVRWEYVHAESASDRVMIWPSNPSPVLFRGQTRRYRPCYPGCVRQVTVPVNALQQLPEVEQASVILNLIRTEWFNQNLRQTAAMRWMSSEKIVFDETAVAQHYGLPTGYIDFSQSFDVAAFDGRTPAGQTTVERLRVRGALG